MNQVDQPLQRIEGVRVPASLVRAADAFGGVLEAACLTGDVILRNGRIIALERSQTPANARCLLLPKLTECHVHLDKCHTVSRIGQVGGDLLAAIAAQRADRVHWTQDDLRARGERGLSELVRAGCGTVRSHVDWSHGADVLSAPTAWHVMTEIAEARRSEVDLHIAALTGIEDLMDPETTDALARMLAAKGGVLGAFVLGHQGSQAGIAEAFRAADRHGLALDFHVDEGLDPNLAGLEMIADTALAMGFEGPVLCGHACALMNFEPEAFQRVADKLARTGITVAALPTTNLYLQGRTDGTPDRRGITRLRELSAAGVAVAVGTDNVCDAFCPVGRHDPRAALATAVLGAHLDPPLAAHFPMITTAAQNALGQDPIYIDGAMITDLVAYPTALPHEVLAGAMAPVTLTQILQGDPV